MITTCQWDKLIHESAKLQKSFSSFIHKSPPPQGPEPLPSLGLNPPLQLRRLRVFGSVSTSQVRGRRVLNKHSVDTCRCGLWSPVHRSGLVFPVTSTHFVYRARRVTQRNRIFSLSSAVLLGSLILLHVSRCCMHSWTLEHLSATCVGCFLLG